MGYKGFTGEWIYVLATIKKIHPQSPLAGETLPVVVPDEEAIRVNEALAIYGERTDLVPVLFEGQVWYVEPEYTTPDNTLVLGTNSRR